MEYEITGLSERDGATSSNMFQFDVRQQSVQVPIPVAACLSKRGYGQSVSSRRFHDFGAQLSLGRSWPRMGLLLVLLVGGATSLSACLDDSPDGPNPLGSDLPTGADLPADEVPQVDQVAAVAAAVDVRAAGCGPRVVFGTGTVIGGDLIITAAHVVAGTSEVEVIDTAAQRSAATVVMFDPDLDIAVLRPDTPIGAPVALRDARAEKDEAGIVVLPRLVDNLIETEVVDVRVLRPVNIQTTDIYLDREVERLGFEIDASIEPGNSGAMVHLPGGGVGIVWAKSNERADRAWAVNIPTAVSDSSAANSLSEPVDVGPCSN